MEEPVFAKKPENPEGPWDVVIIGSGPAGFTAAIYTTRGAASTLILGGELWGGQLMSTSKVDNFPGFPDGILGPDLMEKMKLQSIRFGAEFVSSQVTSVNFTKTPFEIFTGKKKYLGKSVIVATGAATLWLDAPGVKELIGRGVSSCAPCDAPFFKGKNVVVVGGGDSAMEEASVLTKYASEVTIVHRRNNFSASKAMQKKVITNPKIKIFWDTEVVKANGDEKLESLTLKNTKSGEIFNHRADGLFVAIGHKPQSDIFKGILDLSERGLVKNYYNDYHTATNVPGVFVAGDVLDGQYKQAITSAGMGCMAGMDAITYIEKSTEK